MEFDLITSLRRQCKELQSPPKRRRGSSPRFFKLSRLVDDAGLLFRVYRV